MVDSDDDTLMGTEMPYGFDANKNDFLILP